MVAELLVLVPLVVLAALGRDPTRGVCGLCTDGGGGLCRGGASGGGQGSVGVDARLQGA